MKNEEFVFDEAKIKSKFLETSEFEVLFPKHRTIYFKSVENYIIKACLNKKITAEIDYDKCLLKIRTNDSTRDPYIIIKGYEMIQLLSKGMLLEQALKILDDEYCSEIIPIHMLVASEKTFERRRQRLLNPKILKSLELITKCHILIANKNACIIGSFKGVEQAKSVIIKCFENIHPAFQLKELIIKKKLLQDGVEGDWDRYLPKIKKTHSKKNTETRKAGGLPQEIKDRKEDVEMQTGEYFTKNKNIEKLKAKTERRAKIESIRKAREQRYLEPEDD